jgi:hypothetical protein
MLLHQTVRQVAIARRDRAHDTGVIRKRPLDPARTLKGKARLDDTFAQAPIN